jgi:hypothetical protein
VERAVVKHAKAAGTHVIPEEAVSNAHSKKKASSCFTRDALESQFVLHHLLVGIRNVAKCDGLLRMPRPQRLELNLQGLCKVQQGALDLKL